MTPIMLGLRNKHLAILTGGYVEKNKSSLPGGPFIPGVICLSPNPSWDYAKTRVGRAAALHDFLHEREFIVGLSQGDKLQPLVKRSDILKDMRTYKQTHKTVIIFNHSRSEICRIELECTYKK